MHPPGHPRIVVRGDRTRQRREATDELEWIGDYCAAAWPEHPGDLAKGARQIGDMLQRVQRHDLVDRSRLELEPRRVHLADIGIPGGRHCRGVDVDSVGVTTARA